MTHLAKRITLVIAALLCSACSAGEIPVDWKPDCAGQMQLSLPGEFDVAAQTVAGWKQSVSEEWPARFPDEQVAGWAGSKLRISHALTKAERDDLVAFTRLTPDGFKQRAASNASFDSKSFRELVTAPQSGQSWSFRYVLAGVAQIHRHTLLNVNGHLVFWRDSEKEEHASALDQRVNTLLADITYRPPHVVPATPGDCHPYVFVSNGGGVNRTITMSWRLRDHPDITIVLRDSTRWKVRPDQPSEKLTAEYMASSFWTDDSTLEKVGSIGWEGYRPTRLAGRFGVESYVKMRRKDQIVDFGYVAAVQGDPGARDYAPHLLLAVIRESSNARRKGIEPFGDEKSFLELARSIAASVQRRPSAVMPAP